jgi:hypothetical protein
MKTVPHRLLLEPLEPRIAPASIVGVMSGTTLDVSAVAPGTAVSGAVVQMGAHSFDVYDNSTGTMASFSGVDSVNVELSTVSDSLIMAFNSASPFKGKVSVDGNGGTDAVNFYSTGTCSGSITMDTPGAFNITMDTGTHLTGSIKISAASGFLAVNGQAGAMKVSGLGFIGTGSTSVIESMQIAGPAAGVTLVTNGTIAESLQVKGDTGSDSITLHGRIGGKASLLLGDGANSVNSDATIGGAVLVKTGIGGDSVTINGGISFDPFGEGVAGKVSLSLGDGNNAATLGGGVFGSAVRITTGIGSDTVNVGSTGLTLVSSRLDLNLGAGTNTANVSNGWLTGGFKYSGLDGIDNVNYGSGAFNYTRGAVQISLGDGVNSAQLLPSIYNNGIQIKGGASDDTIFIGGATIGGAVKLDLGNGSNSTSVIGSKLRDGLAYKGGDSGTDNVQIQAGNEISGLLGIKPGDGTNLFACYASPYHSRLAYTGGSGFDAVSVYAPSPSPSIASMLRGKIQLGGGNDSAYINTDYFISLGFDGGTGADTMNHTAAALTAGLDFTGFETVTVI